MNRVRLIWNHPLAVGGVLLFLLLVVVYSFSVGLRATRNSAITGDEPFYLMTAQSLLQDGDLDLRSQYASESYREFFDHPGGLWTQSIPAEDGAILSPHEPGTSLLVLPGFELWGLRGAQWTMLLVAATTFALTYVLVALETKAPLLSWLVTAAVALSATAFVYATEIYPEVPAALCLVLSLLLLRGRRRDMAAGVALMLLLTLLAWFGIKYVFLGAVIGVHFLRQASLRSRISFVALSAVSGAIYVALHLAIFGHLVPYSVNTVYEGAGAASVLEQHFSFGDRVYRLWGIFIDERFGIGRWAPLFLLVLPALSLLVTKGRVGLTVSALVLVQLLIAVFLAVTMMGFWFPGRTMMTVLPLFALVLANLALGLPAAGRAVIGLLAAGSLVTTLALQRAVADGPYRLAVDPFDMRAWLFRETERLFPDYRAWTSETWLLTGAWLALLIGAGVWLAWREYGAALRSTATEPRRALRIVRERLRTTATRAS